MSVKTFFENLCLFVGGTVLILGNIYHDVMFITIGSLMGVISLVLAILITIEKKDEENLTEKIYYNALNYLYIVGIILTIGFPITDPTVQRLLFDVALTIATFMILIFIWNILYFKYSFMKIDIADTDFRDPTKKILLPRFLLVSLLLGFILGGINFVIKFLYTSISVSTGSSDTAFKMSSYILLIVVAVFVLILIFYQKFQKIGEKIKESKKEKPKKPTKKKQESKKETPPSPEK